MTENNTFHISISDLAFVAGVLLTCSCGGAVGGDPVSAATATVGTFGVMKVLDGELRSLIETADEATRGNLREVHAEVSDIFAQAQHLFGDDLDHISQHLSNDESTFMANVAATTARLQVLVASLTQGSHGVLTEAIGDADVAAYNALYHLPFRSKPPRVVYWTPESFRDSGEPTLVTIHGNFLDYGDAQVRTSAGTAVVVGRSSNQLQVKYTPMASVSTSITSIDVRLVGNDGTIEKSIAITVQPRLTYKVGIVIHARGRITRHQVFGQHIEGGFSVDKVNRAYYVELPVGWQFQQPVPPDPRALLSLSTTQQSGFDAIAYRGNGIMINYHTEGCHGFLGISCGRGFASINYSIPAMREDNAVFDDHSCEQELTWPTTTYTCHYPRLSAGARVDKWGYEVTIAASNGQQFSVSSALPTADGVTSNQADGVVTVDVSPSLVPHVP